MFEQHPVPQQISSYQFRLVGDMTLKQFFQIAAGAIVALIIYGLPFPGFIKWPLIVIAALSGAAFAFLPIQDRPLEQWLYAFFRSIYSPTYFVWLHQTPKQYFKVDPTETQQKQPTDMEEHMNDLKNGAIEPGQPGYVPAFIDPHSAVADEVIQETQQISQQPAADQISQQQAPVQQNTQQKQTISVDPSLQQSINDVLQSNMTENKPMQTQPQSVEQKEVTVPQQESVSTERKGLTGDENTTLGAQAATEQNVYMSDQVSQVMQPQVQQTQVTQHAQFSPDAAPPLPPDQPNIIKGQVMDSEGHIIDGAILEIKDADGRPVRALRSNKAGHFQIVTSLANGNYTITIEKDGFDFTPIDIEAIGELIQPIAIRAN